MRASRERQLLLGKKLGAGGQAAVYQATLHDDQGGSHLVAAKCFYGAKKSAEEKEIELHHRITAHIAESVQNPGILEIYGSGVAHKANEPAHHTHDFHVLLLPICSSTLADCLPKIKRLKESAQTQNEYFANVVHLFIAMVSALKTLNDMRIAHCDIKTDNIFYYNGAWRLGDLGSALTYDEYGREFTVKRGTSLYWPPELNASVSEQRCEFPLARDMWAIAQVFRLILGESIDFVEAAASQSTPEAQFVALSLEKSRSFVQASASASKSVDLSFTQERFQKQLREKDALTGTAGLWSILHSMVMQMSSVLPAHRPTLEALQLCAVVATQKLLSLVVMQEPVTIMLSEQESKYVAKQAEKEKVVTPMPPDSASTEECMRNPRGVKIFDVPTPSQSRVSSRRSSAASLLSVSDETASLASIKPQLESIDRLFEACDVAGPLEDEGGKVERQAPEDDLYMVSELTISEDAHEIASQGLATFSSCYSFVSDDSDIQSQPSRRTSLSSASQSGEPRFFKHAVFEGDILAITEYRSAVNK